MYSDFQPKVNSIFSYLPPRSKGNIQEYIQYQIRRHFSPHTINSTICILKQLFEHLPLDRKGDVSLISKHDIRNFVEELANRHLSPRTINTYLSYLRPFFSYLLDEDCILKNPVLSRYYVVEETRLPRPMDELDIKKFLAILRFPRDRAMFLLMLRCGMRVGEVSKLKIADIHWVNKTIMVYNGKGKVDRIVYFSQDVEVALQAWLQSSGDNGSCYCFPSRIHKKEHICCQTIRHRMYKLLDDCGLKEKGYTPHCLRHSFATSLLNAGIPLVTLKDLMGHKTFDQTLMYTKLSDQKIRDSYNKAMDLVQEEFALFKDCYGRLSSTI